MFNNDSVEKGCGVVVAVVGCEVGGNGAVNKGDCPNDRPGVEEFAKLGRFKDPATRFVVDDEETLERGDHDDDPNKLGVFGYVKLETEYVEAADEVIGWPLAELNGASSDGDGAADGITGELSVEAVGFADKLPTLNEKCCLIK